MIRQSLKGRALSPVKGALLIAGLAVSIVLVSWVERAVALSTGFQYGSFAVWLLVAAEALAVLRLSAMEYRYSLGEGQFFVERVYGGSARVVHDIPLDRIVDFGPKDEVFSRRGNAQTYEKAVVKQVALPEAAIAYQKGDAAPALLVIQPDEAMAAALRAAVTQSAPPE
ncbi:MAG: hypothetical protein IKO07_14130 [Clostridia bacterium]|nr:hypothetical protein [Clostridia bacterium]